MNLAAIGTKNIQINQKQQSRCLIYFEMITFIKIQILVLLIGFLYGCNTFICGELDAESKIKIERVTATYGDILRIKNIPCEYRYLDVYLLKPDVNDTVLNSVHKLLYDEKTKTGWITLDIYNSDGMYIYTHTRYNTTYKKSEQ